MVYIAYFTESILQICDYAQKRRIWRENCKYALDENFHCHFCARRKAAKFCHPATHSTHTQICHVLQQSAMLTHSPVDSWWCSSDIVPFPSWGLPCISKTSIGGKQPLKLSSPSCTHARAFPRVPQVLALFENHSQWTWKGMDSVAFSQEFFHLGQQWISSNLQSVFATLGPAPPQTHCDSSRLSVFQWKWK